MNINNLSVGNIVSLAYNSDVITTVIAIEFGGSVQVACNNYPDDIRDITGVALTKEILEKFRISTNITSDNGDVVLFCKKTGVYISGSILLKPIHVRYLHQLQNIVLSLTGMEIIDHRKFRI